MTLLEVVIALAILSILVLGFFLIFTASFAHIYRMGTKTAAMSYAQEVVDHIYINRNTSEEFIQDINPGETFLRIHCADMDSYTYDGVRVVYCVGTETLIDTEMTKVTVRVFYKNGDESVILSNIVP
jgi:prepilin-type N-terminal cleavage/methylation domain-containing protein